jgi:hypothetical protein
MLNQHPNVFIPKEKEPWFFSSPGYEKNKQAYEDLFKSSISDQLLGEGSTNYSSYVAEDISIQRIKNSQPNCKFIFIARNPIARIESSFKESHNSSPKYGINTPFNLSKAMDELPQIVEDSKYNTRINKYYEVFNQKQILIIFLEDLASSPRREMTRCFNHLGIDANFHTTNEKKNRGTTKVHDSHLLRKMRGMRTIGPLIAKLSFEKQEELFTPIGLRRSFKQKITWDEKSLDIYEREIKPDAEKFLRSHGKPLSYWN